MSGMQKLPDNHPMVVAWGLVKSQPNYQSAKEWATDPQYVDGQLWHMFSIGWLAAQQLEQESRGVEGRHVVELPPISVVLGALPPSQRETAANVLLMCKQAVLDSGAAVKMGAWTEGDAAVAELAQEAMQDLAEGRTYTHEEAKQLMAERRAKVAASKQTCTDERPCVNWEQYDRLLAHANNIVYDKTKNTLADWVSDYGGRENEKGYVEFGSHYALAKMLDRRDKEVIRNVLAALVGELPAQTAAQEPTLTDAAKDDLAERRRQVEAEGRTPELDDKYPGGQLACAAIAYLMVGVNPNGAVQWWPWDVKTFKPSPDTRRNLIKAGALLLADIEWLDRLRAKLAEPAKQEPLAGQVCSKVSAVAADADDLTQFLEQTDFDAAEKVASDTVANQRELPAGEDDCEGCKI